MTRTSFARRMVAATVLTLVAFLTYAPGVQAQKYPNGPSSAPQAPRPGVTQPPPGPPPLTPLQVARLIRAQADYVGSVGNYLQGQGAYASGQGNYLTGYGNYLNGVSNVVTATGQYYNQVQRARISREQSLQITLVTQRKQIEFQMWYDTVRPTAAKLMKTQEAANLDWARNHAQKTEIWSGRTLNVLLGSILVASSPTQGPDVPLSETVLRGLNLTDGTTRANLSMTKNEGKIDWPEALQGESFDEVRDRFSKNFEAASRQVNNYGPPARSQMNDLRADLKSLEEMLDEQVRRLAPSRYIESRRLLKQLNGTVRGLSNAKLVRSPHAEWRSNVKSVSDLVAYCQQNGLEFAPAADGDQAAYTAAYAALRNYERVMVRPTSLN